MMHEKSTKSALYFLIKLKARAALVNREETKMEPQKDLSLNQSITFIVIVGKNGQVITYIACTIDCRDESLGTIEGIRKY